MRVTAVACVRACVRPQVLGDMGATVEWTPNSITVSRPEGTVLKGVDVDCLEVAMSLSLDGLTDPRMTSASQL